MIVTLHLVAALLVAGGAGAVALVAAEGALRHRSVRLALDRAILAALTFVAVGIALGLVILVTGGRPADPLHLLYAGLALAILPVARFWDRLAGHQLAAVGVGGLVLLGLVLRLFQTG